MKPKKRRRGRPRIDGGLFDQLRLPLPKGMKARIKAVLAKNESVTGLIRVLIERELARRE